MVENDKDPQGMGPPPRAHAAQTVKRELDARRDAADDDAESMLWQGGYSPKAMVGAWILCALISLAVVVLAVMFEEVRPWMALVAIVVLWLLAGLVYAYRRMGVQYELTTQRLIHQSGVFSRRTDRIEVIDIDDVIFEQGPVERMFGIGAIRIESSDRSHPTLSLRGIAKVKEVAGLIDDIRRKERRKRSLHIEAI